MKCYRAHPITIVANLRKVLFLALIPLSRGVFAAFVAGSGFAPWLSQLWLDILALLLMFGSAIGRWFCIRFCYDAHCLEVRSGFFMRRTQLIPWSQVTALSFTTHFSLALFGGVRFCAETLWPARKPAHAINLILAKKHTDAIKALIPGLDNRQILYKPNFGRIAALSLLTSNSFGGILYLAAFVSQTGKLLGQAFSGAVHAAFEQAAHLLPLGLALGLPPFASALAVLLLAGWLIGFFRMFLRCNGFSLVRRGKTITINGGFLTRYNAYFKINELFFADIRQSLLTKLLKLYSLYIRDRCVIFTEKADQFAEQRKNVLPEFTPVPRQLGPKTGSILRYIGLPVLCLGVIWPGFRFLVRLNPAFRAAYRFAAIMTAALMLWLLAVKLVDFFSAGVSFSGTSFTLRYSKGLAFHTVIIPQNHVAAFEIRQSPLMRFGPACDLVVRTKAKSHRAHCCRGLIKSEVIRFLRLKEE